MSRWKCVSWVCWLFISLIACTATDQKNSGQQTREWPDHADDARPNRQCQQLIWQAYNMNRYTYSFDSSGRLSRCSAIENGYNLNSYAFEQKMSYTKEGLLEEVQYERGLSQYHYRNGRLVSIDFFQDGQPIYQYLIQTNTKGQITGLKGQPLQDSGLTAYSTQYRLDERGRYVQLDVRTDKGILYHRVVQRDFDPSVKSPYALFQHIPYDLNRYPWITWGELFPMNAQVARHVETYRYAAPETPMNLIKRSDIVLDWKTDRQGYLTGQFSNDTLNRMRDTVFVEYIKCP